MPPGDADEGDADEAGAALDNPAASFYLLCISLRQASLLHTDSVKEATTLSTSTGGVVLLGLKGWHVSFALFLAFLVPVAPLLAEIVDDATVRDSVRTVGGERRVCHS